jgi:hypothetical protein
VELRPNSKEAAFLGDSDFPSYGAEGNIGAKLYLFTRLYEHYSRLSFSHLTDKPVAISGLEQRLAQSFGIHHGADYCGAGVFQHRSGRWLLWKRAEDVSSLKKIPFAKNTRPTGDTTIVATTNAPPSWSWMSYEGEITYLKPPEGKIDWNERIQLDLTGTARSSWLYTSQKLAMKAPLVELQPEAPTQSDDCSITYDIPDIVAPHLQKFVVIGTFGSLGYPGSRHYVLAVMPKHTGIGSTTYERVGAGFFSNEWLNTPPGSSELVLIE